jgi:hypothetical protein
MEQCSAIVSLIYVYTHFSSSMQSTNEDEDGNEVEDPDMSGGEVYQTEGDPANPDDDYDDSPTPMDSFEMSEVEPLMHDDEQEQMPEDPLYPKEPPEPELPEEQSMSEEFPEESYEEPPMEEPPIEEEPYEKLPMEDINPGEKRYLLVELNGNDDQYPMPPPPPPPIEHEYDENDSPPAGTTVAKMDQNDINVLFLLSAY